MDFKTHTFVDTLFSNFIFRLIQNFKMDAKVDNNDLSHNNSVISQFTKQAIPFAQMSHHSNQYGLELMLKLCNPKQNDTVLDIACGTGIVSCEFAKITTHVTGIDLTPAMIEQAKLLQQEKQLENIELEDWRCFKSTIW